MTEQIGLRAVMDMTDFDAGVKSYNSSIDQMTKSGSELSDSAKNQLASLTDLAQVLSDGGPAKLAATSISQLKQQFMDGSITAEQYASAVTQVQDEFGLVSPTGKVAAGALTSLNAAFAAGEISAEEYAEGLKNIDTAQETTGKSAVELAAQIELVQSAYDAVAGAVGEAIELAELGVQAERTEQRFRAFAGEIGDADELLAAFQKGAGGTVDKMTAMSSAAKLLQMGLVSNNAEMETVVEIATRLGDQTQSAGDRVADFALLLANQSIPRLDNFGISSGKVRARIDELIKSGQAAGREEAFKMAVFEEGAKSLDVLGERTLDAGAKMEMARAKIADMKVEFAQGLLPVVASAFEVIGNLNTKTIAMVAVLAGGVPVVMKLHGALTTLKTGLDTTYLKMGLLAAGIVLLIDRVDAFNNQMDKMAAAQDSAQEAAGSLGDQVQALVADGMSLEDAMALVGNKVDEATGKFNNARIAGIIPLNGVMNASSEFAKTMAEAQSSLQGIIVANTASHAQYAEQIVAYNATLDEGTEKLTIMSEAEYQMAQRRAEGITFLSGVTDALLAQRDALFEQTQAAESSHPAWMTLNKIQEQNVALSEQHTQRLREHESTRRDLNQSIEHASSLVQGQVAAIENRASIEEKAARVADMQATSALAAAAALEAKRQQDNATAVAEADLATKVMDASDAMIAQTFISGLDPDEMGLTAYRDAVENIQLAFGLATPESIALSRGITQGIDAANEGKLAYKDLDAFILALREDAADGSVDFDNLAHSFASSSQESQWLAENIDKTGDAIVDNVSKTEELIAAEAGLEGNTKQLKDQMMNTSSVIANVADETELWTDSITGTERAISSTQVTTEQWATKMQDLDSRLARTGEDALSTNDKIQGLNAALERTYTSGSDASTGLEEVEISAGETAAALEEATAKTNELDAAMSETAGAAPGYGSAIGSGLRAGMEPQMDGFVASFRQKLQSIRDQLPSSEPKDHTSPLYDLGGSGEAIIDNLNQGIDEAGGRSVLLMDEIGTAMGQALAASVEDGAEGLFDIAGVLSGLGGAAAGILQRRTLDPLEQALGERQDNLDEMVENMDSLVERQSEMRALLDEMGPLDWIMLEYAEDRSRFSAEEVALIEEFIANQHERARLTGLISEAEADVAKWSAEAAEQQERLLRLQQQQENLRFLQQQAELLALIAEKGLDVDEVLGGLQLGLDANIEDVIDAMSRAMQLVIEQAEEELGIASPSKVFEKIGAETMSGMAMGIERLMSLPVAQSAIATQAMIAAPAAIMAGGNTTIDNSRSVGEINVSTGAGGTPASNAQLIATIRQVVREEVRGA